MTEPLPSVIRILVEDGGVGPFWNGAWKGTGKNLLDFDDVPLSEEVRRRMQAWAEAWGATYDPEYPPDSHFPTPAARLEWLAEGRTLAQQVANELAGRAKVLYADYDTGETVEIPPTV